MGVEGKDPKSVVEVGPQLAFRVGRIGGSDRRLVAADRIVLTARYLRDYLDGHTELKATY